MTVVDQLLLECAPEALHRSIIKAVPLPAHGRSQARPLEKTSVFLGAILTWAELFAEVPVKRNGRRRKQPQPASLSLFEWTLVNDEHKREEELAVAGR